MAEPTSLFLTAALAAGFVEGASVLGYHHRHRRASLASTVDISNSDRRNNATPIQSNKTVATVPSVSMLAAHAILYGLVAAPLGLVGASPGIAFLPSDITVGSPLMSDKKEKSTEGNDTCKSEAAVVVEEKYDRRHFPSPSLTTTTDIHGNRNLGGWVLRQENSKKLAAHNKNSSHSSSNPSESSSMHTIQPDGMSSASTTASSARNGYCVMQPSGSRYIATLDGRPLPTALAESMRRARCLFIGAGLISYVMTQYYLDSRQQQYLRDNSERYKLASDVRRGKYSVQFGYDQWINTKSVELWNERIQNGKSVDDYGELFHKLLHLDEASHHRGLILSHFLRCSNNTDALEIFLDGIIYRAMQLSMPQLKKDSDKFSDEKNDIINERPVVTAGEKDKQLVTTPPDELDNRTNNPIISDTQPSQQGMVSPNASWSVVVTAVDVLGTSIRHLVESTYRLASSAASVGRRSASRGTATDDENQTSG